MPPKAAAFEEKEQQRLDRADRRIEPWFVFVPAGTEADKHLRYDDLWFEDGSVVIVAGELRLKLHRTTLARYSSVFRDMFQLVDPGSNDVYEGCPVVQVTDNPQYLVLFFNIIYDGIRHPFFLEPKHLLDFRVLRALALLSSKYDVVHIQKEVRRRLQICFPSSLKRWDNRYPESCTPSGFKPHHKDFQQDTLLFFPVDMIAVVNLARLLHFRVLLPTALYVCSMLPLEDMPARIRYSDFGGDEDVEQLTPGDLSRCLRAVDTMRRRPLLCSMTMFNSITHKCERRTTGYPEECRDSWHGILALAMEEPFFQTLDILYDPTRWIREKSQDNYALCSSCLKAVTDLSATWRKERWIGMPKAFDL